MPLGFVWQRERGAFLGAPVKTYAIGSDVLSDVLKALLTQILESEIEFLAYLFTHLAGNADASRLGNTFEPSRNVHAIAVNVVAVADDVAEVDANTKLDPVIGLSYGVSLNHSLLHLHSAAYCVEHT